jgi:apolipoprotein N-acyltransferase
MIKTRSRVLIALVIAGALHGASFALFDTNWSWVVSLMCLAGFASAWFNSQTTRQRLVATAAFSLSGFLAGLYWLHITMHVYGGMHWLLAAAAVLLFSIYLTSFWVAAAWIFSRLSRAGGALSNIALFAACLTLAELARGYIFTGFPWMSIGYAQVDSPLAFWAPWVGVYGVGFACCWAAGLLAWWLVKRNNLVVLTLVSLIVLMLPALTKINWVEPTATVSVALVQTNFKQDLKFDGRQIESNMMRVLAQADAAQADLVVLPETVWPVAFEVTKPQVRDIFRTVLSAPNRTVVMGLPFIHPTGEPRMSNAVAVFNSPNQIDPQSPSFSPAYVYSKNHLVPFGEFIPLGFGWFVDMLGMPLGEFRRGVIGQEPALIKGTTGQIRAAFNICYEDIFGEEIAIGARSAEVLINLSNLAWFDRSVAIPQHLNIARMRTIETQRPMLRATNTGATAVINPDGTLAAAAPYWQEQTLTTKVTGTRGRTPFVKWTNWPVTILVFTILALIAAGQAKRRL